MSDGVTVEIRIDGMQKYVFRIDDGILHVGRIRLSKEDYMNIAFSRAPERSQLSWVVPGDD
jgi:hypothetical protein